VNGFIGGGFPAQSGTAFKKKFSKPTLFINLDSILFFKTLNVIKKLNRLKFKAQNQK
jgi:hypothetical protein